MPAKFVDPLGATAAGAIPGARGAAAVKSSAFLFPESLLCFAVDFGSLALGAFAFSDSNCSFEIG